MSTTGYGLEEQINDLNAELRDTRATLRQSLQHRDTLRAELAEARAQIAEWRGHHDRKDHRCFELAQQLEEAQAQIAAKDAALDALDEAHQITQQNLWQDITELRASLAGKEQEHQDFRLQNDAEWRAKLDHLKAQITTKDAEIAERFDEATRFLLRAEKAEAEIAHLDKVLRQVGSTGMDPYEAERLQRVTRGITEIETLRMKHSNINTGEKE